jgi:hypothetical protein
MFGQGSEIYYFLKIGNILTGEQLSNLKKIVI